MLVTCCHSKTVGPKPINFFSLFNHTGRWNAPASVRSDHQTDSGVEFWPPSYTAETWWVARLFTKSSISTGFKVCSTSFFTHWVTTSYNWSPKTKVCLHFAGLKYNLNINHICDLLTLIDIQMIPNSPAKYKQIQKTKASVFMGDLRFWLGKAGICPPIE